MRIRKSVLPISTLAFVALLGVATLWVVYTASAQTSSKGSIEGTLTDVQGAAVPGVTVTVTRQGGGSFSATTNDEGFFRILNLEPGNYTVTVEAEKGFARFEQANVPVNLSKTSNVTIQLRPGSAAETVEVTASSGAVIEVTQNTSGGTQVVSFNVPLLGAVRVYLPDDMAAGDTISGTLQVEPKRGTETARETTRSVQGKYVIEVIVDGAAFSVRDNPQLLTGEPFEFVKELELRGTLQLPAASGDKSNVLEINLNKVTTDTAPRGRTLSTTKIPVNAPNSFPTFEGPQPSPYSFPTLGQTGRPLEIVGPFDGNSGNTTLRYGPAGSSVQDFEKNTENVSGGFGLIRPLAESPRKIVFPSPNVIGPITLNLKEGDSQTTGIFRNVGVRLSAPKTNLLKGEKTTLTTEVTGLQGIKVPVPLTLEAKGVITMEGGMFQPLYIQPSQVSSDGRYVTTRGITGLQAGSWSATSTVVTTPYNIILRDPNPPQTFLFNSFTGDYVFCGSGLKLTGTGQIQRKGCTITLTHNTIDRRIFGSLDACTATDNSRYSTFYSPGTNVDFVVTVTDTQPVRRNVSFNPPGRPLPAIQDVSAFATCP
jgi:hypothetical protein